MFVHTQVEVTKFEDLEETHAEVKLKQALWKSQQDWATDYASWLNVRVECDHQIALIEND